MTTFPNTVVRVKNTTRSEVLLATGRRGAENIQPRSHGLYPGLARGRGQSREKALGTRLKHCLECLMYSCFKKGVRDNVEKYYG